MPRFVASTDLAATYGPVSGKIAKYLDIDPLQMDAEIATWRALVEQAMDVYEQQFAAYREQIEQDPSMITMLEPPSIREITSALSGVRAHQETLARVRALGAVPREVVVQLVHRVRAIVQAHCPEAGRQKNILAAIGSIDLPY